MSSGDLSHQLVTSGRPEISTGGYRHRPSRAPAAGGRADAPEIRAAEVFLHLCFGSFVLMLFTDVTTAAGPAEWLLHASFLGLVLCGAVRLPGQFRLMPPAMRWWILSAGIITGQMILRSVLGFEWMQDPLQGARNLTLWAGLPFLPALAFPCVPRRLARAFRWHAIMGAAICGVALVLRRELLIATSVQRGEGLTTKESLYLLYSATYVLFRFAHTTTLAKCAAVLAMIELAVVAVISGTRQGIPLMALTLLVAGWCIVRGSSQAALAGLRKAVLLVGLLVALAGGGYWISQNMSGGIALLTSRITQQSGGGSLRENTRWLEIQTIMDELEPIEYFTGRGVLSASSVTGWYVSGGPWRGAHIGYANALLRGGIPLVVLLLIPGWMAVRTLLVSRAPATLASAAMVLFFTAKNATGQGILVNLTYVISILCLGALLSAQPSRVLGRSASNSRALGTRTGARRPWVAGSGGLSHLPSKP